MKIVVLKRRKTRQSVGFPGSVGCLLKSVAMNLLLSMVVFLPNKCRQAGFTRKVGQWEGISEVFIRE